MRFPLNALRSRLKAARGGRLVFAKKQENTGERPAGSQADALRFCVRCFVGTERPFANYVDFASSEFRPLEKTS